MQPVGLPAIAWMPPYVAHVPTATTPHAFGASRSSHQLSVSGSPVASSLPNDVQYPSPLMFSFGIEPSMTSTNGASSSPRTAWRNGSRNSSPPSVGERTLLWRWTFGIRGIAPSTTSSGPGWPAAVTDTESPSQLMPSEIHRMWTSSTAGAFGSVAIDLPSTRDQHVVLDLQGVDQQLLAPEHLHVEAAAARAAQRQRGQRAVEPARPAPAPGRHDLHRELRPLELGPLGHEGEGELERGGHDLPQPADLQLDARDAPALRMRARDPDDGVGDRELVHRAGLSRSSATGRRRAGPSPAGPRTRSPPAPSRAARYGPRRPRPPARSPARPASRRAPRRRARGRRTRPACPRSRRTSGRCRGSRRRPQPPPRPARPPRGRASPRPRRGRAR